MTPEEMIVMKSNRLIAEFMGAKYTPNLKRGELWLPYHGICRHDKIGPGNGKIMMYHSSWDWRMPVVDKIESMEGDFSVNIDKYSVEIRPYSLLTSSPFQIRFTYNDGGYSNAFNKGHALYKAIVEFVKWFNQNQKS